MLVELDEEHTKCGICVTKFSSDRDNKNLEIRKHLPVLSSSQRCDHWFCHGCILREQLRVAEENNGKIPKWIKCMHCREKTSFNPAEPKYHRLLIDLLARAQKYAAAQLKNEEQEKSVDEQLDSGRATSIKREADAVDDDEDEDVQLNACMKNENDAVDNEEYAAAQVKADQTEVEENETTDADVTSVKQEQNDAFCEDYATSEEKVDGEGAGCVKRESDITDLGEQEVKRVKLIAPSPPLVRVKEEPTEFDDYDEATSLERRAPLNEIDTSTNNADNTPASPKVVDKDHRMCFVCKVAKSLDCFSKNQRKKGENATCMDCIGKLPALLAAKNKAMEDLEERICVNCNIVKKEENFGIKERKKGEASVCMSCNEEAKARLREQLRMRREESIKVATQWNAESEVRITQKVKTAYETYVSKLKASGSTIEMEMTKQTDLLYIVTSISSRGDQFGPCLHGIYNTCQKAQEAARKTFEKLSESYRDGVFVSNENRVAKCDMTKFLIPGVVGAFRPLFEVFRQDEDDDQDCTAIAINVVRIGIDVEQSFPYIWDTSSAWIKAGLNAEKSSADSTSKDAEAHAIFSFRIYAFEAEVVNLLGIYKDREGAMNRAREYAKDLFSDEESISDQYSTGVTNGELFVVHDVGSVSIETVILNNEHGSVGGRKIGFSAYGEGSSVWMSPRIEWY